MDKEAREGREGGPSEEGLSAGMWVVDECRNLALGWGFFFWENRTEGWGFLCVYEG